MSHLSRLLLEVAIASTEDAIIATVNGADRLELSSGLELGGLTPSLGLIETVRRTTDLPVLVLIRPLPGGFHYNDGEFQTMCRDAELALAAGADGIVVGILTAEGDVDCTRCDKLRRLAGHHAAVFHRAFDVVRDPFAALEEIIQMGFQRILTSGQAESAHEGIALIRRLVECAGERIEILPGAGIKRANVRELIATTGCRQVHGSFRGEQQSTDAGEVRAARGILDECFYVGETGNRANPSR